MLTDAQLAAALIGTKQLPPGLKRIQELSRQARAYHTLSPYPLYYFADWKTEDRGPLPRCMPLARRIVKRGARFLFGKPLQITVPANKALEEELREAWRKNRMDARLPAMAENAGLDGGIALKFSFDPTSDPKVRIQSLSIVNEVRLYYHPHDREKLLMARVQYPFTDSSDGKTYWYREEWTAEMEVHYLPVSTDAIGRCTPDEFEGWQRDEAATKPNPFGLIPIVHVKNLETDDLWGAGDLWEPVQAGDGLYRIFDRLNLTYHLMDRSNQYDSQLNPIYIDLEMDEQDVEKPIQPGQPLDAKSDEAAQAGGHQGKVQFPPSGNALRPQMMEYARDLRNQLLDAGSSVQVDQKEFTNKGNLTVAVLEQLYLPQIEITVEKQKTWGVGGLVVFFAMLARGLTVANVLDAGVTEEEESYTARVTWAPPFAMSEDEKAAYVGRVQEEEIAGYTTHERAVQAVAHLEGVEDVETLLDELKSQPAPTMTATQPGAEPGANPLLDQTTRNINEMRRIGGPAAA